MNQNKYLIGGVLGLFLLLIFVIVFFSRKGRKEQRNRRNLAARTAGYLKAPEKAASKSVKDIYEDLLQDEEDEDDEE